MKIKKDVFVNFIKQATMTGVSALQEGIIDFSKSGIVISSETASNNVLVNAVLSSKVIEEYEAKGQVGINSFQDMVKLLEGFAGEYLKFIIKGNQLVFSSARRRVKITLMDSDAVKKPVKYPDDLKKRASIKLDMEVLKGFFKNMTMINSGEFNLSIKGSELYFNTKGFNEVTEKVKIEDAPEGDISLKLSRAFVDAVENLTGVVVLELKSDYPITISSKTKGVAIKILVAPIVKEEK